MDPHCDVLVADAGCGGICAAVQAAWIRYGLDRAGQWTEGVKERGNG